MKQDLHRTESLCRVKSENFFLIEEEKQNRREEKPSFVGACLTFLRGFQT